LHNIESAWHYSMAASGNALEAAGHRRFAKASSALEDTWLQRFDSLLVTSCDDARLVEGVPPETGIVVYPNALPEMPCPPRPEKAEIVFSANLEYPPNIAAVQFFQRRIWPALRERWPELNWNIIGRCPQRVQALVSGDPRIQVTGSVEHAVPLLAQAQVAVVPVLAGSGTRFKILEAWAAGTPVVSTTLGAQGLEGRDQEHLLLADDPDSFATAVSRLLASAPERARIGAAGRKLYEARYTWPVAWKALDPILE
jgi:glycosyltransferase involved in cell wall biosynthesis